jgi:hypothetical protein
MQQPIEIYAYDRSGKSISDGLVSVDDDYLLVDQNLGLIAYAHGDDDPGVDSTKLALEILLDDMQTNLHVDDYARANRLKKQDIALACVEESYHNIHDYLIEQSAPQKTGAPKVSLSSLQIVTGRCQYLLAEGLRCLRFSDDKLVDLTAKAESQAAAGVTLGQNEAPQFKPDVYNLDKADRLLVTTGEIVDLVGLDYLRVTLSRFLDSPQTALRQIASKIRKGGLGDSPLLAIITLNPS